MFHTRKRFDYRSRLSSCFAASLFAVGAAVTLSAVAGSSAAGADPIAADGAVGVDAQWEQGASPIWYIELQRQGIYDVVGGIQSENDAEIRAGLQQFDWGFAHQAADGSFPGTAGGSTGPAFHSTSLFVEAAARAALLLKSYHPTTYTLDTTFYNAKVAQYTAEVHATAEWLTTPSVASAGQLFNMPYTHRRYLLAAGLAEAGALTGDPSLTADALPYIQDGLSRQLPAGWRGAVGAPVNGAYPAATLVAPNTAVPLGTKLKVSCGGVNPELNGYDSGYQCLGLFYANTYLPYCTNAAIKKQMVAMIKAGLTWEKQFVAPDGTISITGDSRMGIEQDRNGETKAPTIPVCWSAFDMGAQNTGDTSDLPFAGRIADFGSTVDTNTVYADGAVDGNEAWESNPSLGWSISNQKIGVDYVEQGIADENDALIQTGVSVINWGFQHQNSDGSFGTTSSPYYGDAAFVESAARAASELKSYAPKSYTPSTNYAAWASTVMGDCVAACNWLTSAPIVKHYDPTIATSTAKEWTQAAALAETGYYNSVPAFQSDAAVYAANAIGLQTSTGEDPESGAADVNYQALGLGNALRYAATCGNAQNASAAESAASNGLIWEGQYISPAGVVSGTSSPALLAMKNAYTDADSLSDADYFDIVRFRLGGIPVE